MPGGEARRAQGLDQESVDRPCLLETIALHGEVQVTVMLNRVAVCIEQSCVPIAQRLVAFGAMERQAEVATRKIEL